MIDYCVKNEDDDIRNSLKVPFQKKKKKKKEFKSYQSCGLELILLLLFLYYIGRGNNKKIKV
jgi:hypothetical protein